MRTLAILLSLSLSTVALAEPPPRGDRVERAAEREAEVLEWVASQDAEKHERLMQLKERDPERYRMAMHRSARLMKASEHDPELIERRERMSEIKRELRALSALDSDDKKVNKAREEQVRELVEEGVDLKLEMAEARIDAMEAKLEEAREKLEEAKASREDTIEEHVADVLSGEPREGRR